MTQLWGKMRVIPRNEAFRPPGNGNLKKGLVARVRQQSGRRRRSHNLAAALNMAKENQNLVCLKPKLGTTQNFAVFGQNARIEAQRQVTGRNHTNNLRARTERREKTRHKDIGVEDYLHLPRFLRTALISALISSREIPLVPFVADRR